MKYKLIGGLIAIGLGIVLLIYGFYGASRMAKARGDIDTSTGFLPESRATGMVRGGLHGEVDKYKLPVALCFVGGVVLIVGGVVFIYFTRKKK